MGSGNCYYVVRVKCAMVARIRTWICDSPMISGYWFSDARAFMVVYGMSPCRGRIMAESIGEKGVQRLRSVRFQDPVFKLMNVQIPPFP